MTVTQILTKNTDELIALGTVGITMLVSGYQAVVGAELTMPTEPAMLVLGYYFGKKVI